MKKEKRENGKPATASEKPNRYFEKALIGKTVRFRSTDWKTSIVAELVDVEQFIYIVRFPGRTTLTGILKHSVGTVTAIGDGEPMEPISMK